MGKDLLQGVVSIAVAVLGIALVAVLVGRASQTSTVLTSAGSAFSGILKAAVAPASGG